MTVKVVTEVPSVVSGAMASSDSFDCNGVAHSKPNISKGVRHPDDHSGFLCGASTIPYILEFDS